MRLKMLFKITEGLDSKLGLAFEQRKKQKYRTLFFPEFIEVV